MTLGKFRELTAELPDKTPMLLEVSDHCYCNAYPSVATAIVIPQGCSFDFDPDFGNDPELYGFSTEEDVIRNRVTVVVFE